MRRALEPFRDFVQSPRNVVRGDPNDVPAAQICDRSQASDFDNDGFVRPADQRHARFDQDVRAGLAGQLHLVVGLVLPMEVGVEPGLVIRSEQDHHCLGDLERNVYHLPGVRVCRAGEGAELPPRQGLQTKVLKQSEERVMSLLVAAVEERDIARVWFKEEEAGVTSMGAYGRSLSAAGEFSATVAGSGYPAGLLGSWLTGGRTRAR